MSLDQWTRRVDEHARFLDSGGAGGLWCVVDVDGIPICVYYGAESDQGAQFDLDYLTLPPYLPTSGVDLRWADLAAGVCQGVDFSGACLDHAAATDSDFVGACFDGASLRSVDFSGSDLTGASFRDADLRDADFECAILDGADFRGASLQGSRFPGATLVGARRHGPLVLIGAPVAWALGRVLGANVAGIEARRFLRREWWRF